jgi:hypothetical protein
MRQVVSLVILALAACAEPAPAPVAEPAPAPAPRPASVLDPARGAILPPDKAQQLAHQCSRLSPGPVTGTWTPTPAMIAELESALGAELEKQIAATPETGFTPQTYYRQYAGLMIGGREVIYVNGVAAGVVEHDGNDLWKTRPITICDGGTITFGVEYDPATRALSNFAFNGRL